MCPRAGFSGGWGHHGSEARVAVTAIRSSPRFFSFVQPILDLLGVFSHVIAIPIAISQMVLSGSKTLLSSFSEPLHGLLIVLRHSMAVVIALTQAELSISIPLLSSFGVPLHGLLVVVRHSMAANTANILINSCTKTAFVFGRMRLKPANSEQGGNIAL